MRIVNPEQEMKNHELAERAILYFDKNPGHYTYANGDPEAGQLLAIRWNPYTVLVIRLHEDFEPACYSVYPVLNHDLPPLRGEITSSSEKQIPLNWTCPRCGHEHNWQWPRIEVETSCGNIDMTCDNCCGLIPCILGIDGLVQVLEIGFQEGGAE